jgi:hypothetical protein
MTNPHSQTSSSPTLLNLIVGSWVSQAITVAARLGIADRLGDGPRSSTDLARSTETNPDALYRLLRALAGVGIFAEDKDGRFALTPLGQSLRSNAPDSLCAYAIFAGEECFWRAWGRLLHSVRTGQGAFEHVFGAPLYDYLTQHPETAQIFDAAMTSRSSAEDAILAAACDIVRGTIIDVGCGRGSLVAAILRQSPQARAVLFDRPPVIAGATALIREAGIADRCQFVAGDFFDRVPSGGDAYLLKRVIHNWDDARAGAILANCRAVMAGNSRLLLLEEVILPGSAPAFGKLLDLQMLVQTPGGRERTEAGYATLLGAAELRLTRVLPTGCALSIIEAIPR